MSDYKGGAAKETIKKAWELLNKDFDPCLDFWLAITECQKKTFEEDYTASQIAGYWGIDKEYFNKLNYDNINEEKNFELIIVLFGKLKIDIEDFNSYSAINLNIKNIGKINLMFVKENYVLCIMFICIISIKSQKTLKIMN